jgi:hypothetical protein
MPYRQTTMTQAYSTPPRSVSYAASGGGSDYGEPTSNEENIGDQTYVPPGWQTFRDERNQQVFFNRSTGQMEYSLDDLFKKPRSSKEKRNAATSSTTAGGYIYQSAPSSRRIRSAPSRPSPDVHDASRPRPDDAPRSSSVVTPRTQDGNSTSTSRRVPGVVDLVSSEGGAAGTDSDEETFLDDSNLPRTEDFDFRQHRGSDGGRDDDESDCESEILV